MTNNRKVKFAAIISGVGGFSGWRHPEVQTNASVSLDFYKEQSLLAEKGKFAVVFIPDGAYINEKSIPHFLNRFEPVTILSALAAVTKNIGLIATISTAYSEPFNVARQIASLDQISGGRAGWNLVTTPLEGTALNFNKTIEQHPEHGLRYKMATEYLEVVQGLWDSWDDDAFIGDKENDRFFDPEKLHTLNHKGEYYSVQGPLNVGRSRQGQPVVFQAGSSEAGKELAAKSADAVYTNHKDFEEAKAFYQDLKEKTKANNRNPDNIQVFHNLTAIIGDTREEAEQKYEQLVNFVSIERALDFLGRFFDHHDFSQYDVDAPFPELGTIGENSFRSTTDQIKKLAKEQNLTLRQVALNVTTPKPVFFGTPEDIADKIEEWFLKAADGFVVANTVPHTLEDFVNKVVPILQQRGLCHEEYESDTLRGNLGLPFKESRYAKISTTV